MNVITQILFSLAISLGVVTLLTTSIYAQDCTNATDAKSAIQCGSSNTSGVPTSSNPETALQRVINDSINILSIVVGIVAVILIIFAGFRFITSSGDPSKVASAKNALVYALIGLAIVALAQFAVKFVLNQIINPSSGGGNPPSQQPPPGGGGNNCPPGQNCAS